MCSIEGEGSDDPTNCFASCSGGDCEYWAYYARADGAWRFSNVGAATRTVRDGDIDGWAWGAGGITSGAPPEDPPEALCWPSSPPPPFTPTPEPPPPIASPPPAPPGQSLNKPTSTGTARPSPTRVQGGVAGATVAPQTTVSVPAATPIAASATPQAGVLVSADEGAANIERSLKAETPLDGDGAPVAMATFGAVVTAMLAAIGFVAYRRYVVG